MNSGGYVGGYVNWPSVKLNHGADIVWDTTTYTTIGGNAKLNENNKFRHETLYNVIVVDTVGDILLDEKVVDSSPENAKFKLGVYAILDAAGVVDLNEVTIVVKELGAVKIENA